MMENDKKDQQLVPNDHGALGEPSQRKQELPKLPETPGLKKATSEEGLNEEKSEGDSGAFEGFENPTK